jgi:hypothetical protein
MPTQFSKQQHCSFVAVNYMAVRLQILACVFWALMGFEMGRSRSRIELSACNFEFGVARDAVKLVHL